jgi:two-component system, cell cycle response regulator CtrA
MKFLIIRPSMLNATKLEAGLQGLNQSLLWRPSIEEAVSQAQALRVDGIIVFTDLGPATSKALNSLRRNFGQTAVVVITPKATSEKCVTALNAGADCCVDESIGLDEFMARVRSVVRRCYGYSSSELSDGPLVLNLEARTLSWSGVAISITRVEYDIAERFMLSRFDFVSRDEIFDILTGPESEKFSLGVESALSRFRYKLMRASNNHVCISAFRGSGYKMVVDSSTLTVATTQSNYLLG